ncbi:MAG: hypothetical protein OEY14_15330, partial [Myxococcales bacterium]|nr:hypothetical protein [Myxococcales bacterium]
SLLRADRFVVDDVSGAELLEVLAAASARTGRCLVGVHAETGTDMLAPFHRLAGLGGPSSANLAPLLSSAVHVVVQLGEADGLRRVLSISETLGLDGTDVRTQDLYEYDGGFASTGSKPTFG